MAVTRDDHDGMHFVIRSSDIMLEARQLGGTYSGVCCGTRKLRVWGYS